MPQKNLTLSKEAVETIERLADQPGMTQGKVVSDAVTAFDPDGFEARVEQKLNAVLESVDTPRPDERGDLAKNKSSTGDATDDGTDVTGADIDGGAVGGPPEEITPGMAPEALPSTVMDSEPSYSRSERVAICGIYASADADRLTAAEIEETIDEVWSETGGPSKPTMDKYVDLVGDWLVDQGWHTAATLDEWVRDEDEWRDTVGEVFDERVTALRGFTPRDDPETIEQVKRQTAALSSTANDLAVAEDVDLRSVMERAREVEEAAKELDGRDGRSGGGAKNKNLKDASLR